MLSHNCCFQSVSSANIWVCLVFQLWLCKELHEVLIRTVSDDLQGWWLGLRSESPKLSIQQLVLAASCLCYDTRHSHSVSFFSAGYSEDPFEKDEKELVAQSAEVEERLEGVEALVDFGAPQ